MSENTTILSLPLIQGGQAQKHITHNEALRRLDALVQPVVLDADRIAPPALPRNGDRHLVPAGATDDWSGQDGTIAVREDNAWAFVAPAQGWRVHVIAAAEDYVHNGSTWAPAIASTIDRLPKLGVNADADSSSRLAVAAQSTLLTHAGAGHQLKINKAGAGDTATLLFQTGYAGRAEMGCAGDDAFSIKVSADGTAWTTALRFDQSTGHAEGAAVQSDADDTAPGKLARTDWTYGRGNLLSPVATQAGQPTGGVIERIETADGSAVRYADGTMICYGEVTLTREGGAKMQGIWSYPASFSESSPVVPTASVDHESILTGSSVQARYFGALTLKRIDGTQLQVNQFKGETTDDFGENDVVIVNVVAFGRWD